MKTVTTFKPFTILASVFVLLLFCSVISSSIEEQTGTKVSPIALAVGVVALGAVAIRFSRIKKGEAAFAVIGASIFNMDQLQLKDIVTAAIIQHYGWKVGPGGNLVEQSKGSGRKIPAFTDEARIIRHDLFQIKYLTPTEATFEFFNVAQSPGLPMFSNFLEAVPNDQELNIYFGMSAEVAIGAAAADTPDILPFGAAAAGDEEVINGLVTYEINKRKELENQHYKGLFVNDDAIKNFLRFPKPLVWEPGSSQGLIQKLSKAYAAGTHRFQKFSLVGYKLTK